MRSLAALKMLLHDRSTTAGAVLGVVAIVFLVGQQLSVLFGLFNYMSVLVDHSGADIWVCSKNTANVNATGTLPVRYVDRLSGLEEIEWVEPVVFASGRFKRSDGQFQVVQVVGVRSPRLALGPWRYDRQSPFALFDADGVTVDSLDLNILGDPEIDQFFEISDTRVRVSAITRSIRGFSGTLVFTNMVKAKEIVNLAPGRCSAILIKLKPAADAGSVIEAIRSMLPRAEVLSSAALSQATRTYYIRNTGIGGSFGFSTLIGALVGMVIIMLTMYTSVLHRQKEFAVLRALGARKIDIFLIVLYQSLMIGIGGIFIGFLLLAFFLYSTHGSRLPSYMPQYVACYHALGTLLLCLVASLFAMRKATSVDPASVFR
jgi:putative ABC transport system permease protein